MSTYTEPVQLPYQHNTRMGCFDAVKKGDKSTHDVKIVGSLDRDLRRQKGPRELTALDREMLGIEDHPTCEIEKVLQKGAVYRIRNGVEKKLRKKR